MRRFDETRERFMAAIAEKVTASAIVEVHLFHPMKQGAIESGVAVVAMQKGSDGSAENVGSRLVVYTAKYRLTLKGPDRGKWEFSIQAEADAPLVTVDAVVRGVQRRVGDAQEPDRLTGDEFIASLPKPLTPKSPAATEG